MKKRTLVTDIKLDMDKATVAGRVMSVRKMKNYCFCDVTDMSGKIQLIISAKNKLLSPNVGDIVSAFGSPLKTRTGQLSIDCLELQVLSKSNESVVNAINNPAPKEGGVWRQRSLDLMVNDDLRKMIKARSLFIGLIRDHFRDGGFLETDTPVLSHARFAGTASVFETKSRSLDRNLYLRGTLEDYLKQLVVAGFEKVFQIGDCFRNESPSLVEFTMLEATWAFGKSEEMLQFIQDLITKLCSELPDDLVDPAVKEALSAKMRVVTFWGILNEHFGVDIRSLGKDEVKKIATAHDYAFPETKHYEYELAKFGYDVIKRTLSKDLEAPTFVGRFPACISPLAKEIQDGSGEADRGYGFFKGQRLFEVVMEASDYQEQLSKFEAQDGRSHQEHSFKHDELLTALSYGCPPMAGLGFNINRVLAVLLNVSRTSDVLAFPLTSAALPL